jgi:aminotransferase
MRDQYLSRRVAGMKASGIRKFFDIAATMKDVISLGVGEPDFTTPAPILKAGVDALNNGHTHYTSNFGIIELRRALSKHLEALYNVRYNPEKEIIITVGGSEALNLAAIALLNPGDEVIIPTPCFVSYQASVIMAGGVAVEVPCKIEDNFDFDPDQIRAAITPRTKGILVGFPNNPTGAVSSRENLLEIAKIAEEHDLIVLSDEIYDRLVYGVEHICYPALPGTHDRTLLLGGFSKDYAMTGWRIGYVAGPEHLINGLLRVHQYMVMSAPTIAQYAGLEALLSGEPYVQKMVAEYDRRRKLLVSGLNQIGLATFEPKGAFYAFPKVDVTGLDDETFCDRLLKEEHVAIIPGSSFGAGGEGFARACYATGYDQLEEALERIERFVGKL